MKKYISLRKVDKSFHTIIIKKKVGEFTYIAALGDDGSGVYEEFYAKLKNNLYIETAQSEPDDPNTFKPPYWKVVTDLPTGIKLLYPKGAVSVISGFFSRSFGSEWEEKIITVSLDLDNSCFEAQVEDLSTSINSEDSLIQLELLDEIKKYVYYGHDVETDKEYEYPVLKDIDFSNFKNPFQINPILIEKAPEMASQINTEFNKMYPDTESFCNEDWDDELLEITCSNIWVLSHSFTHIFDEYL